jgi:hypothetical protein
MKKLTDLLRKLDLPRLWRVETFASDQLNEQDRRFGRILEVAIVIIIMALAANEGARVYKRNLASANFYQTSFGPAVNFACNGQFTQTKPNEAVQQFLERKSNDLVSCRGIEGLPSKTINSLERSMIYLELASAITWRFFEFSWASLYVVAAALTAGFALAIYSLLRVFCGSRVIAAISTSIILYSAPVLSQIPHLRDFSKAPFLIGALACIGASVLRLKRQVSILLSAMGAGAMIAIGLGFRPDLNVVLPIAVLAPLLIIGGGTFRWIVLRVGLIWIGLAVGYVVFQLPLSLVGGAHAETATFLPHVFMLGFAEKFLKKALGMSDAYYSVFRPHFDEAVFAMANLFDGATHAAPVSWGTSKYDQVTTDLLTSTFFLVPYDSLFRVFYTVNAVGHLPINRILWGLPLLLLTPLLLFTRVRPYLFVVLAFGTLMAVLSLQYDERHAFYMVVLSPIIVVMSSSAVIEIARRIRRVRLKLPKGGGFQATFILVAAVATFACFAVLSQFFAASQRTSLRRLTDTYSSLEWQPIEFRATDSGLVPTLAGADKDNGASAFVLKQSTQSERTTAQGFEFLSRLTIKLQPPDIPAANILPVEFSWAAVQEKAAFASRNFTFSTRKNGYAVESTRISGPELASLALGKKASSKVWLRVVGETLEGAFYVGLLNQDRTKFAFNDYLPRGKWQHVRRFDITPDLDKFSILFSNVANMRSTIRVDKVELVILPDTECWWVGGAVVAADYDYVGQMVTFGGFSLPEQAGLATYYFPQAFTRNLHFTALSLTGISPDCIVDWSVARNFPAGTVPAELLLMDGKLNDFQRGDWKSVWYNFLN